MEQVIRWRRGRGDKSPVHPGKFPSTLNPKKLNHGPARALPEYRLYQKGKI